MRTQRRLGLGAALIALTIVAQPSLARAQAWLEDRARTEGPGFRVGDFELHPGLGVELGYDSNLYYSDDDDPVFPRVDTAILRATAHLLFSTRGPQRRQEGEAGGGEGNQQNAGQPAVTFRGGLSGSFYHFFADSNRTNMEADASLALGILPGRPFSINLFEEFSRTIRPFTENSSIFASFGRIQNTAGIDLNFATTGEVLKITPGYRFGLDFFESSLFQYGNNFRHTITLSETFRFLPQTAVVHDTAIVYQDYWTFDPGAPTLVNDALMLRTRVGLNGAFTSNFSVLALVGYGAGFFDTPSPATYDMDYESIVAQLEARWQITPQMRLVFGYDRDFQPSFVGNFYRRDRGYANFQTVIDRVFLVGLAAEVGGYEFGAIVQPDAMTPVGSSLTRSDIRIIGELFAEYRFTDWLGVNGTLRYSGAFTDFRYRVPIDPSMPPVLDPAGFSKFEAWLGVRVFY